MGNKAPWTVKTFGDGASNHNPVFVGIDQSYSGFAVTFLAPDGGYETHVAKFEGSGVERLYHVEQFLYETFFGEYPYEYQDIAMEGYAFGSQFSNMLGELGGLVKIFLYKELNIKPLLVPPPSLKKYVTGKGSGIQKNQILLQVYKKWGIEFTNDNAADSYALAKIVSGLHSLAYEEEIYTKLNDEKHRA